MEAGYDYSHQSTRLNQALTRLDDERNDKSFFFSIGGPFCFCMNSNNNTYNCLRTINSTHNYLYCEFITGVKTFYNLNVDVYQKWNRFQFLLTPEKDWLHDSLVEMMRCKGSAQCAISPVKRRKKIDIFNTLPLTGK